MTFEIKANRKALKPKDNIRAPSIFAVNFQGNIAHQAKKIDHSENLRFSIFAVTVHFQFQNNEYPKDILKPANALV